MVNIGPTIPPSISAKTVKKTKTRPVSVGVSKQLSRNNHEPVTDRRGVKDRRQKNQRPLIELRSGRDRRRNNQSHPSVDINA